MYSLVTLLVVFGILGSVFHSQLRKKAYNLPGEVTLVFSIVAFAIGCIAAQETLENYVPTKLISTQYKLSAMRTTNGTNGSFVIGSGTIGSFTKFSMYVVNDDDSVSPFDIHADGRVKLIEDPSLNKVGYLTRTVKKYDYSTAIANWVWQRPNREELVSNQLRVPVGTVLHNFSAQ